MLQYSSIYLYTYMCGADSPGFLECFCCQQHWGASLWLIVPGPAGFGSVSCFIGLLTFNFFLWMSTVERTEVSLVVIWSWRMRGALVFLREKKPTKLVLVGVRLGKILRLAPVRLFARERSPTPKLRVWYLRGFPAKTGFSPMSEITPRRTWEIPKVWVAMASRNCQWLLPKIPGVLLHRKCFLPIFLAGSSSCKVPKHTLDQRIRWCLGSVCKQESE